jgi:putative endonuclease
MVHIYSAKIRKELALTLIKRIFALPNRGVEQLVARWAHNPKVVGSSPTPATTFKILGYFDNQGFFIFDVMFNVYILYSRVFQKTYVGFTSNLPARFKSHNKLGTKGWTIRFRPWEIIHIEKFATKKEAMEKEKWFKSGTGREFILHHILKG